ncbi:MAG TPA: hypothetical protein VNH42_02860 [Mariprofundaceae bacterium]|nr:hypothetical protein [Mariprofundaceae bacterium]
MATLQGHAIPLGGILGKLADHTYVTCTGGHAWPCWGRSAGGKVICSGTGSSEQANCIAGPASHAGLVYAITGVCHQTANRVLWPARVLVTAARGYWISSLLYGTYGKGAAAWAALRGGCSALHGELPDCMAPAMGVIAAPAMSADESRYVEQVQAIYAEPPALGEESETMAEPWKGGAMLNRDLTLLAGYRIQAEAGSPEIKSLIDLRDDFHYHKGDLDAKMEAADISVEHYVQEVNAGVVNFQQGCQHALGDKRYAQLTGLEPGDTVELIDPEIAAATLGRENPM